MNFQGNKNRFVSPFSPDARFRCILVTSQRCLFKFSHSAQSIEKSKYTTALCVQAREKNGCVGGDGFKSEIR